MLSSQIVTNFPSADSFLEKNVTWSNVFTMFDKNKLFLDSSVDNSGAIYPEKYEFDLSSFALIQIWVKRSLHMYILIWHIFH